MTALLLLAFIGVPVIEIMAFIEIGGWIGLWPTIAVVIATALAGTALLRMQGLAVLRRFQDSAARGELPVTEVFDGLCLLVAGLLLLTPGFFTDALGFLLFVPPLRMIAGHLLWRWLLSRKQMTFTVSAMRGRTDPTARKQQPSGITIDGEFDEVEPSPKRSPRSGDDTRSNS